MRRGEDLVLEKPATPPKGILIPVPLFHVTGSTSMMVRLSYVLFRNTIFTLFVQMGGAFVGAKVVFMRKWEPKEGI